MSKRSKIGYCILFIVFFCEILFSSEVFSSLTKEDVSEIRQIVREEITTVEKRLDTRITDVEKRLDERITTVEKGLNQRIDDLRSFIIWGFGVTFAGIFTLIGFVSLNIL